MDRPQPEQERVAAIEFALLRALCSDAAALGADAWQEIGAYRFSSPLHQVVFDALRYVRDAAPDGVRAALLVELTRRGFPDVDVSPFFSGAPTRREDVVDLVRRLRGL